MSKRKLTGNERLFPKYGKTAQYNRYVRFIDMQNYVGTVGGKQVEVIDGTNTSVTKVETDEEVTYQVNVNVRAEDDFADDVAAGLGGIVVGGLYHNNGEVRVRLPEVILFIESISPSSASPSDFITLRGTGFTQGMIIIFDATNGTVPGESIVIVSSTEATCTVPFGLNFELCDIVIGTYPQPVSNTVSFEITV